MVEPAAGGAVLFALALSGTLVESLRRRHAAAAVNAAVALAASLVPVVALPVVAPGAGVDPALVSWTAAAGFLHVVGVLGFYDERWWWDHLTHTVSAALVAALAYAGLLVVPPATRLGVPAAPAAVALTLLAGVFWELVEVHARAAGDRLGLESMLARYGPSDTPLDLLFDLVGAVLVAALDIRVFVALAARSPTATRTVLWWGVAGLVVGTVVLAVAWRAGRFIPADRG